MGTVIKRALKESVLELKVPFFDCDPLGIVWHGHYIKYFEQARCEVLESIGYNYNQMKESGYAWPIIKVQTKHVKPAKFNQEILVYAGIVEYEHQLTINFEIKDKQTKELICKGQTTQVAIDMNTDETCFFSPKILCEKLGVKSD